MSSYRSQNNNLIMVNRYRVYLFPAYLFSFSSFSPPASCCRHIPGISDFLDSPSLSLSLWPRSSETQRRETRTYTCLRPGPSRGPESTALSRAPRDRKLEIGVFYWSEHPATKKRRVKNAVRSGGRKVTPRKQQSETETGNKGVVGSW